MKTYLEKDYLKKVDGYFRACNYLSVAQLYLLDNPLLKTPKSLGIGELFPVKILFMRIAIAR